MIQTLTQKKLKKLSKYKDLEIRVSRIWKMRTKTVSLGKIKNGLHQNLQFRSH